MKTANYNYLTLKTFKERFYIKYPDSNLEFLELLSSKKIKVKTNFGICINNINNLYRGKIPTISSSVNKTEYFINQANSIYKNKYNYCKVNYVNSTTEIIIICKQHGEFIQTPTNHITIGGCRKCEKRSVRNTEEFIYKANIVHKNKFDYSLVNYINHKKQINIICFIHGVFKQTPNNHLNSKICCSLCENKLISDRLLKTPTGWNYNLWEKSGKNSKNFDSFKVYIIKCYNEKEEFYKIGKTFRKLKQRFHNNLEMPYKWEIIKIFEGEAREISELEVNLKNTNKKNKYLPKILFEGKHECYNKLENYEEFFIK